MDEYSLRQLVEYGIDYDLSRNWTTIHSTPCDKLHIKIDATDGTAYITNLPKKVTNTFHKQLLNSYLSQTLDIATILAQLAYNNPENYNLVTHFIHTTPKRFISEISDSYNHSYPEDITIFPPWITQETFGIRRDLKLSEEHSLVWFAPHADPTVFGTPYLTYSCEILQQGTAQIIWKVKQIGVDSTADTALQKIDWDDSESFNNAVNFLNEHTAEMASTVRALSDGSIWEHAVARKNYWQTYHQLWEETKPKRNRTPIKLERKIRQEFSKYIETGKLYIATSVGLGGKIVELNKTTYFDKLARRNVALTLIVRPNYNNKNVDENVWFAIGISKCSTFLYPDSELYILRKKSQTASSRQTWWITTNPELLIKIMPYTLPAINYTRIQKNRTEEYEYYNPAEQVWQTYTT